MSDDDDLLAELGHALGHDPSATPSPERVAAVRAAATRMPQAGGSRRRFLLSSGIAARVRCAGRTARQP